MKFNVYRRLAEVRQLDLQQQPHEQKIFITCLHYRPHLLMNRLIRLEIVNHKDCHFNFQTRNKDTKVIRGQSKGPVLFEQCSVLNLELLIHCEHMVQSQRNTDHFDVHS